MSTKTSHRRHARGRRTVDQFIVDLGLPPDASRHVCRGRCTSQCDECHDIDNCVEATTRYGDLLLCKACRKNHPAIQPWRVDAVSGEFVDATGRVL